MSERGILEGDAAGYYRIKPPPNKSKGGIVQRWVSPQMANILKSSGTDFSETIKLDDDEDAYYEKL